MCNHEIALENSKIITTNPRYLKRRCLKAWYINSVHAPIEFAMTVIYYQKLICILLIDDMIIGLLRL